MMLNNSWNGLGPTGSRNVLQESDRRQPFVGTLPDQNIQEGPLSDNGFLDF